MNYPIVVYPCEEGGFVAEIPALKGCLAQGETLEETLQELIIVRNLWLETAEKHGQKLSDIEGAIAKVKALSSVKILRMWTHYE
jgi:predicted RNase H-like HicB family nuclease